MDAVGGEPKVRFDSFAGEGRGAELRRPLGVIEAWRPAEVVPALRRLEEVVAGGVHAGGFLAYEAAGALEPHLVTHAPRSDLPLLWFGLFAERVEVPAPRPGGATPPEVLNPWVPTLSEEEHAKRVGVIRELIAAGDTYQVNLTFPLRSRVEGPVAALYGALGRAQRAGYCASMEVPGVAHILSVSPELFFRWADGNLELRPMKGTRPRGRWSAEDRERAEELHRSSKDRAENLMIVDLVRNDAGRVAVFGSVEVASLFEVESYPTVHQLTSTVRARTRPEVTLTDILRALFPSGSVTGAPKARTMEIITGVEDSPRGVYTGAIGLLSPGEAVFNVPIRTLVVHPDGEVELAVGSGITYDSDAAAEYAECLQKAAFTGFRPPIFSLLETMVVRPGEAPVLFDRHLARLTASAGYFGFPFDPTQARSAVEQAVAGATEPRRVRLLLSAEGVPAVQSAPFAHAPHPLRARVASEPIHSSDPLLYHKTTFREPYERRLTERPGYDEVLLTNERGELTEFANGNLVIRRDGIAWTPPLDCGLLPGVLREALLEAGELRERVLRPDDLKGAEGIFRINSVRSWEDVVVDGYA